MFKKKLLVKILLVLLVFLVFLFLKSLLTPKLNDDMFFLLGIFFFFSYDLLGINKKPELKKKLLPLGLLIMFLILVSYAMKALTGASWLFALPIGLVTAAISSCWLDLMARDDIPEDVKNKITSIFIVTFSFIVLFSLGILVGLSMNFLALGASGLSLFFGFLAYKFDKKDHPVSVAAKKVLGFLLFVFVDLMSIIAFSGVWICLLGIVWVILLNKLNFNGMITFVPLSLACITSLFVSRLIKDTLCRQWIFGRTGVLMGLMIFLLIDHMVS